MDNVGNILLTVCGLSVLCIGTLAVVAFVTGRSIFSGVMGMARSSLGGEESEYNERPKRGRRSGGSPRRDIRGKAQSLDFDDAVSRHRKGEASGAKPKSKYDLEPPRPHRRGSALGESDSPPLRRGSGLRRSRDRERDPDEIYDYFDDEEGGDFL